VGLIDTHCHVDMLKEATTEVLAEARAAGVEAVIAVGIDLDSSRRAVATAERHDEVFAAVGMHPHDAVHFDGVVRTGLERLLKHPKVVAVGECGLDFYRDYSPRDMQRATFVEHLEMARAARKPVVVHTREAAGETFAVLTEHAAGLTVILHCFSAPEYVELCNERGYYLSFAGNLTYKRADDLRVAAGKVREDLLLVETDAPFLPPEPHRGTENRPARVALTAALVGSLRGWDAARTADVTSANARRAFGLPAPRRRSRS
jgi:TatD DNase family protein